MDQDQIRRIHEAIAECDRFLEKESARNASLRPADVQQYLNFCITHRAKLVSMLGSV